jgi:hypothetical protein
VCTCREANFPNSFCSAGLGSGSECMSGDAEDDLCDDPSSVLDDICQGARLDLLEEHQHSDNPYHR